MGYAEVYTQIDQDLKAGKKVKIQFTEQTVMFWKPSFSSDVIISAFGLEFMRDELDLVAQHLSEGQLGMIHSALTLI